MVSTHSHAPAGIGRTFTYMVDLQRQQGTNRSLDGLIEDIFHGKYIHGGSNRLVVCITEQLAQLLQTENPCMLWMSFAKCTHVCNKAHVHATCASMAHRCEIQSIHQAGPTL